MKAFSPLWVESQTSRSLPTSILHKCIIYFICVTFYIIHTFFPIEYKHPDREGLFLIALLSDSKELLIPAEHAIWCCMHENIETNIYQEKIDDSDYRLKPSQLWRTLRHLGLACQAPLLRPFLQASIYLEWVAIPFSRGSLQINLSSRW